MVKDDLISYIKCVIKLTNALIFNNDNFYICNHP
jgi:hypothetical protein